LDPLTESAEEVNSIKATMLNKNKNLKVLVGVTTNATVENLKKIRRPRVLHLSTHGEYVPLENLPESEREAYANPFSRVRIALTGADHSQAGYVTAHELARMDLTGTRLVVLNACKTGLGDLQPGEAIASLSQAVFMAGALATLTTLYSVYSDTATKFTQRFYELWLELGHAGEALAQTKREAIARQECPMDWAGYVLNGLASVASRFRFQNGFKFNSRIGIDLLAVTNAKCPHKNRLV
jgi:CHAT domain-containing protein